MSAIYVGNRTLRTQATTRNIKEMVFEIEGSLDEYDVDIQNLKDCIQPKEHFEKLFSSTIGAVIKAGVLSDLMNSVIIL